VCVDVSLSISSREGVEIDFCPQCRGVWLDRGELDKIIERAAPTPTAAGRDSRPPSRDDRPRDDRPRDDDRRRYDDDDDYYKKRKKRSFLEDIFDF
jgi:Zn-finger nucleic acid-binding protein